MATVAQTAAARPVARRSGFRKFLANYFYFLMSLLVAATVVWGFHYTIRENLLHPAVPRPRLLWFHAAVFAAWVLFFIFQSALVRTHNVKWHRFFGWFGVGLGTLMPPLGVVTAIVMTRFDAYRLHLAGAREFLIVPLMDMLLFAAAFALAVAWRKKPEYHRRLIFVATCFLLDAAFGRNDYLFDHNIFFFCVDAMILLGVARDLVVDRRIHRVYLAVLPLVVVIQLFEIHTWRSASAWWMAVAGRLVG